MKKVIYKVVRNEIIDRKVASVIQKFIYETYIPTSTFKSNKMMKEISGFGLAIGEFCPERMIGLRANDM